jgi:multiple sugar transport system permease protein
MTSKPSARKRNNVSQAKREAVIFWVCVAPWVIGFVLFQLGPILAAFGLSFTRWNILTPPELIGTRNYTFMFTRDQNVLQALRVTAMYSVFAIPLQILCALGLAVLLNEAKRGVGIFRTLFYLPSIVASVAIAVLWTWIFNPEFGPINGMLRLIGIKGPAWLLDPRSALWALIIMSAWGVGGQMLIFLAGLKGIPRPLYEAAEIDGAGRVDRFRRITLPLLSPTIFFNAVTTMIGSFQTFDSAYIISTARSGAPGSPEKSTLFFMLYTYATGISEQRMGYALALGMVLFAITFVVTMLMLRTQHLWVYNEQEAR